MKILSLSLVALASAPSVLAQAVTTNPDVPGATRAKSILDAILTAGPVMFVLIALSVFSVMLVVVYLIDRSPSADAKDMGGLDLRIKLHVVPAARQV